MNAFVPVDSIFCDRLCLTLGHSLWQFTLLACLSWMVGRLRQSPAQSYRINVVALFAGILVTCATFLLVQIPPKAAVSTPVAALTGGATNAGPGSEKAAAGPQQHSAAVTDTPALAVPEPPHAPRPKGWSTLWVAVLYGLGVAAMLARLGLGVSRARRIVRRAMPLVSGELPERLAAISKRLAVSATPALVVSREAVVPQLIGLVRPVIVLPAATIARLSADDLELILRHELAHGVRWDLWVNLVQRLAEAVLFFNPALWLLSRRIDRLREYCCDDIACRQTQKDPEPVAVRYAAALLRIAELSKPVGSARVNVLALAASGRSPSELRRRIARLCGEPVVEPVCLPLRPTVATLIVVLFLAGPAVWPSRADNPDPNPTSTTPIQIPATDSKPTVEFSSGTVVEAVAIGAIDQQPERWWGPLGNSLDGSRFVWKQRERGSTTPRTTRRVILHTSGLPEGASFRWHILGAGVSQGGAKVEVPGDDRPGEYATRAFRPRAGLETVGLRVGLAAGEWETIVENRGHQAAVGLLSGKGVLFSEARPDGSGLYLVVSHNYSQQDCRVVAIDRSGELHQQQGRGGNSAGQITMSTVRFPNLSLDRVDHFRFQVREYEWASIEGLPLVAKDQTQDEG
ncbi:MAG: M56 family metallopeptidase [Planctomycetota bacterium]